MVKDIHSKMSQHSFIHVRGRSFSNVARCVALRGREGSSPGIIAGGKAPLLESYSSGLRGREGSSPGIIAGGKAPLLASYSSGLRGREGSSPLASLIKMRAGV